MNATQTPDPRITELVDLMVENNSEREMAEQVAANLAEKHADHLDEFIASLRNVRAERAEITARFRANPTFTRAFSPAPDWKGADDRYAVAREALQIAERAAAKHGLTVEQIAEQMVTDDGTVASQIDMYGTDPRLDGNFATGAFYAVRCRIGDAIDELKSEERERETREREAARDAAWEKQGLTRCDRCGGAGGANHWPGYTCFDCGGRGAVDKH